MAGRAWWAALMLLGAAGVARADDGGLRDLCPDRPGLDSPPCIVDRGHLLVEVGGVEWMRAHDADSRTDTVVAGDTLLRYGLNDTLEALVDLPVFGTVRTRDRASGAVSHRSGTGDLSIGLKQNLREPDGSGASFAVSPFVTAPTGGRAIGAGTWAAGVQFPVAVALVPRLTLIATPEIDAAADEDRHGRHLRYGAAAGLSYALTGKVTTTIETAVFADRDPADAATPAVASATVAWQPTADLQLDAGAVAGLDRAGSDVALYFGVSRRF